MKLTVSGVFFLVVGVILIAVSYSAALPGLLPAGVLLCALPLVSLLWLLLSTAALTARTQISAPRRGGQTITQAGVPVIVTTTVEYTGWLTSPGGTVTIDFDPSFGRRASVRLDGLARGQRRSLQLSTTPLARGHWGVRSVSVEVDGPFRLAKADRTVQREHRVDVAARVYPMRLPGQPQATRSTQDSTRLSAGRTTRDFHAREYVPGDDLRFVHWPSTARLGELMVRQEAEEQTLQAVVIMDTAVESYESDGAFELMATAALSASIAFLRSGFEVVILDSRARPVVIGPESGPTAALLASASLRGASGPPGTPSVPLSARHAAFAVVCCGNRGDASVLTKSLPRRLAANATILAANEVDIPSDLAAEVFAERHGLPAEWLTLTPKGVRA